MRIRQLASLKIFDDVSLFSIADTAFGDAGSIFKLLGVGSVNGSFIFVRLAITVNSYMPAKIAPRSEAASFSSTM